MKNSQTWSMDIMLAIVIFIGTVLFFYLIISNTQGTKTEVLEDEASHVMKSLVSDDPSIRIIDGNEINSTKLEDLLSKNYSNIKKKFRIENEFCIYLEDEEGNIVHINTSSDAIHVGIGSEFINVSDVPCG